MCPLYPAITWGRLRHAAEPAAFIKQVVNGSEIKFGKVNITSWICALSWASSFHPPAVSSYLSNWSYWLKRRWPVAPAPPSRPTSSLLPEARPGPSQRPSDLMSPAPYLHRFYAFLHTELWLTPGRDEPRQRRTEECNESQALRSYHDCMFHFQLFVCFLLKLSYKT